jgi:hypothetical protein
MPFPQNYEILPGCERHNYETNPTGIISFEDPQLEIKFKHRSCVGMVLQILLAPLFCSQLSVYQPYSAVFLTAIDPQNL